MNKLERKSRLKTACERAFYIRLSIGALKEEKSSELKSYGASSDHIFITTLQEDKRSSFMTWHPVCRFLIKNEFLRRQKALGRQILG